MYIQVKDLPEDSTIKRKELDGLLQSDIIMMEQDLGEIALILRKFVKATGQNYLPMSYDRAKDQVEVHTDLATLRKFCTEGRLMMYVSYRGGDQWPWEVGCTIPTIRSFGEPAIHIKLYTVTDEKELEDAGLHIHLDELERKVLHLDAGADGNA